MRDTVQPDADPGAWRPHDVRTPTLHGLVTAALASQPDRALLADESGHLTNVEFLAAIERRARHLQARCGEGEHAVAVHLDYDRELAITYFACLAAGLRYLPLPHGPPAMIGSLLETLRPRLLVTSFAADPGVSALETFRVDDDDVVAPAVSLPEPDPRRIAHVLLTSGSETGAPKAVLTDHVGSLLSHRWRTRRWPFQTIDVVGCNIFGIWDVVPALLHGVPLVMLDDATLRDPVALSDAVLRYGITRMMLTPTLLDACLASPDAVRALRRLHYLVLCGETVTRPLMTKARERLPDVHLANLYSLSECHDVAAGLLVPDEPFGSNRVADFADVHVVRPDDPDALVPVGEPGRILIGGRALARGYTDPEATARRFFHTTLGGVLDARRVYDTGDLGRLDDDGTLTVLGRLDAGLKIRGAWSDPEAVTQALLEHPAVARAVAMSRSDPSGHTRLDAFVVPAAEPVRSLASELRAYLAERLPAHSVPARLELLDELPLLPSGKIDRSKLHARAEQPTPDASAPAATELTGKADNLPRTVLDVFREVLDRADADAGERFDDLGGDSLCAVMICGRLRAATGRPLRVQDLYAHPTAGGLAAFLARRQARPLRGPPALPNDPLPTAAPPRPQPHGTVVLTGATGTLGATLLPQLIARTGARVIALVRAGDDDAARHRLAPVLDRCAESMRVTVLASDLARPELGLAPAGYESLVREVDAVIHLGARLDMFADEASLARVNVSGTRTLLELALSCGATFHHLSSSAVLPLDSNELWDEGCRGRDLLQGLAPRLEHSDGYSRTKWAAEALVWQAAEQGLPVTVTRVPHLIDPGGAGRLQATLATLLSLEALPEGPWHWQAVAADAVCDSLIDRLEAGAGERPLHHATASPISDAALEAALAGRGHRPRRLTLPALANQIEYAVRDLPAGDPHGAGDLAALNQLMREHGLRAALCLNEPRLATEQPAGPDPVRLLVDSLPR